MWKILQFLIITINIVCIFGKLSGDHICLTEETFLVNVTENYVRNTTLRKYQWCYNVPPRCSYYTIKEINDSRVVTKNETRLVEKCCPGFLEKDDQCVLSCPSCKNGLCENGTCYCFSGYKGEACDLDCKIGEWGPDCLKTCNCPSGMCDSKIGICLEEKEDPIEFTRISFTTPIVKTTKISGSTILNTPSTIVSTPSTVPSTPATVSSTPSTISSTPSTLQEVSTPTYFETVQNSLPKLTTDLTYSTSTNASTLSTIEEAIITNKSTLKSSSTTSITNKSPSTTETLKISTKSIQSVPEDLIETHSTVTSSTSDYTTKVTILNNHIATKEGLLIPVEIHYDQIQKPTTYSSTIQDRNFVSMANEEYLNRQISNNNNFSTNDFALFGVTILLALMLVVIILSINFLRKKKRKIEENDQRNHPVSVFSANIFHSPLPEPPVTENPLYLNPLKCQNGYKEMSTFETRIICNVNSSPHSPSSERGDFEYDHPPSSGSYRAASLVDPIESKTFPVDEYVIEPVYDEIPQKESDENTNANQTYSAAIYINTCGRTKF